MGNRNQFEVLLLFLLGVTSLSLVQAQCGMTIQGHTFDFSPLTHQSGFGAVGAVGAVGVAVGVAVGAVGAVGVVDTGFAWFVS